MHSRRFRLLAGSLLLLAAVTAATTLLRTGRCPADVHWTGDSALKALQVHQLATGGFAGLDMAPANDAQAAHFPFPAPFARSDGETFRISYSLPFAVSSVPWYTLAGYRGLFVWMGLTFALLLLVSARAARRAAFRFPRAGLVVLALLSPLTVYALLYTEHLLAVVLCTAAIALVPAATSRRPWLWALASGVAAGAGPAIRPECYCWLAGLGLAYLVLWSRRQKRVAVAFALGALLALAPLWGAHLAREKSLLGQRVETHVLQNKNNILTRELPARPFWEQPRAILLLAPARALVAFCRHPAWNFYALLGVAALGALVRFTARRKPPGETLGLGLFILALLYVLYLLLIVNHVSLRGLLAAMPLAFVLAWPPAQQQPASDVRRAWVLTSWFFAACVVGMMIYVHGGRQWGPRYLFPAVPCLAFVCAERFAAAWQEPTHASLRRWANRAGLALLVGCSVLIQFAAVSTVHSTVRDYAGYVRQLEQFPETHLVFDERWLPQIAAPALMPRKTFYLVNHAKEWTPGQTLAAGMQSIGSTLQRHNIEYLLYSTRAHRLSARLAALEPAAPVAVSPPPWPCYRLKTAKLTGLTVSAASATNDSPSLN